MAQNLPQKVKKVEIFNKLLFEIGKFRKNRSFEKVQMTKLGAKHVFQKTIG